MMHCGFQLERQCDPEMVNRAATRRYAARRSRSRPPSRTRLFPGRERRGLVVTRRGILGMRALVLAALLLTACGAQSRDPDITGQVTSVSESGDGRLVVVVEDRPGAPVGIKLSVMVDRSTRIFRESGQGKLDAQPGELATATLVSVWMGGKTMALNPGQGKAETVLIRSSAGPSVPLPRREPRPP